MFLYNPAILLPAQKLVSQGKQVRGLFVKVVTMTEQVQAQFQAHPIVTLIVGKLDKRDYLLKPVHYLVILAIASCYPIKQFLQLSYNSIDNYYSDIRFTIAHGQRPVPNVCDWVHWH